MPLDDDSETRDALAAKAPFQPPASLGDIWRSQWDAAGLETMTGVNDPAARAVGELRDAFTKQTGQTPSQAWQAAHGVPLVSTSADLEASAIGSLSETLPDAQREALTPFLDVRGRSQALAQETERTAQETAARTYGISGTAVGFMAGLARTMVDPVNVATVFAGGPEAAGLRAMLTREFLLNAGVQAVQEPFIQQGRQKLGLTNGNPFADILEAGVGGAGLAALLRAGGWALRKGMAGLRPGDATVAPPAGFVDAARPPGPEARDALGALAPEDFDAAARHVDARTAAEAHAPDQSLAGRIDHTEQLDAVAAHVESGQPLDFDAETWQAQRAQFENQGAPPRRLNAAQIAVMRRAQRQAQIDAADEALRGGAATPDAEGFNAPAYLDDIERLPDHIAGAQAENARLAAIHAEARRGEPDLFGKLDDLEGQISQSRAQVDTLTRQLEAAQPGLAEGRIADLEAQLGEFTGKRRSSPAAKAVRAEIERLRQDTASTVEGNRAQAAQDLIGQRLRLADLRQQRARLGPQVHYAHGAAEARLKGEASRPRPEFPAVPNEPNPVRAARQEKRRAATQERLQRAAPARGPEIVDPASPAPAARRAGEGDAARVAPVAASPDLVVGLPEGSRTAPQAEGRLAASLDDPSGAGDLPPIIDMTPKPKRTVTRKTPSLFEAIAGSGGIQAHPEIKALFDGNPFVPGFGRLMRKGGLSVDKAFELAHEQGYLFDPGSIQRGPLQYDHQKLYDLLDREGRGNRVYTLDADRPAPVDRGRVEAAVAREADVKPQREAIRADIERSFRELGLDVPNEPGLLHDAEELILSGKESDPLVAFERAVMEDHGRSTAISEADARTFLASEGWKFHDAAPDHEIPFDLPREPGTAPEGRAGSAQGSGRDAGAQGGTGKDGGSPRAAGEDAGQAGPALEPEQAAQRADVERALAEAGDQVMVSAPDENGVLRDVPARQALQEADDLSKAAQELQDCIFKFGGDGEAP